MDILYNSHWITLDDNNNIIDGFSDAFRQPQADDICINEQGGYHFRLFPGGEENPPLRDEYGVLLYRYVNSEVIAKTSEELEAERPQPSPPLPDTQAFVLGMMEGLCYE